jgi:hypothetical protein
MVSDAQDNLISAKVSQPYQANKGCSLTFFFKTKDCVVLSTLHRHRYFRAGDNNCMAKFMPRFNGPFLIKNTDEKTLPVTISPYYTLLFSFPFLLHYIIFLGPRTWVNIMTHLPIALSFDISTLTQISIHRYDSCSTWLISLLYKPVVIHCIL